DRPLLDQTKAQLQFQAARDLLELDTKPCESILIIEFYEDVAEQLSILQSRKIGVRTRILTDPAEMNMVWSVRKSGLSLLTGCIGAAKPVAFIEDAAVRPAQLPDYVRGLQSIMKPLGLTASYYGHAASGLLHVRLDTARRLQSHKIDNHLRENFTRPLELPFQPGLAFAFKDRSFTGNLEQCNGCGGCLKQSGIMCPTFIATHDEVMSTRGRANIIRAALELQTNGHDPMKSDELDAALSNCLSCKGCTPECPSNVNLA